MAATNSTARRPCVTKTRPIIDYLLPRSRAAAGLPPCRPDARPCLYAPQLEKTLFFSISRRADPQYEPIGGGRLYDRILQELERPRIGLTLNATRGHQNRAAQLLGSSEVRPGGKECVSTGRYRWWPYH